MSCGVASGPFLGAREKISSTAAEPRNQREEKIMKTLRRFCFAMVAFLLMFGFLGAVPAEAASLIRSVLDAKNEVTPDNQELYGNYRLYIMAQGGYLTRMKPGDYNNQVSITTEPSGAVANDTTTIYSTYNKNVLTIWKSNIETLKKTKLASFSIKAKYAGLCGFYNNVVYYRAISKKGANLMFSYPLSTKVSKKMGSGVTPVAQVSRYLIYQREKLDGTEGMILKSYDIRSKKSVTIDSAMEIARRVGKYIYFARYGKDAMNAPAIQVYKYDLDTNKRELLLSTTRNGTEAVRLTSEGLYSVIFDTEKGYVGFYTDYASGSTKEVTFGEAFNL